MAQPVQHPTLDLSPVLDLRVMSLNTLSGSILDVETALKKKESGKAKWKKWSEKCNVKRIQPAVPDFED